MKDYSLCLSREDWGVIIDALMLEIERSEARKKANSESTSDVRVEACKRLMTEIAQGGAK